MTRYATVAVAMTAHAFLLSYADLVSAQPSQTEDLISQYISRIDGSVSPKEIPESDKIQFFLSQFEQDAAALHLDERDIEEINRFAATAAQTRQKSNNALREMMARLCASAESPGFDVLSAYISLHEIEAESDRALTEAFESTVRTLSGEAQLSIHEQIAYEITPSIQYVSIDFVSAASALPDFFRELFRRACAATEASPGTIYESEAGGLVIEEYAP